MGISKYNSEGYRDPTTYAALTNIEAERRAERLAEVARSPNYRPIVFICSPYADDPAGNRAPRHAVLPVCRRPGVYSHRAAPLLHALPERSRSAGTRTGPVMGQVLLTKCVELWVFGSRVTSGMEREIAKAEARLMPIRYFTEDLEEYGHG